MPLRFSAQCCTTASRSVTGDVAPVNGIETSSAGMPDRAPSEGECGLPRGGVEARGNPCAALHAEHEEVHYPFGAYPPGGAASATGALQEAFAALLAAGGVEERLHALLPSSQRTPARRKVASTSSTRIMRAPHPTARRLAPRR